ncbi:MAG TPA: hypothetical protein VFF73_13615 [Planctomycetota bacterium]|nr:hypothetical protein [Planctomycetota bacterium]
MAKTLDDPVFGRMIRGRVGWSGVAAFSTGAGTVAVSVQAAAPAEEHRLRFTYIRARWTALFESIAEPLVRRVSEIYGIEVRRERIELVGLDIREDARHWSAQFTYRLDGADDDYGFFMDWDGDQPVGEVDVVD